jgi:transposase
MSVAEQRYRAVLAVIGDGGGVRGRRSMGVSRRTLNAWLARCEQDGLEGLVDRSRRPARYPHQMDPAVQVAVLEARRRHPGWGPRRLVYELKRQGLSTSESGVVASATTTERSPTGRASSTSTAAKSPS